jgi:hypothetical protein
MLCKILYAMHLVLYEFVFLIDVVIFIRVSLGLSLD